MVRKKKRARKTVIIKTMEECHRGPRGNVVEEDETISLVNYKVIGLLTDSISSRVVGTRPVRM